MLQMVAGQKAKFTDLGITPQFSLTADITSQSAVVDVACFGLDAQQKLVNDDYMTFYNQPVTPCGAVRWQAMGTQQRFDIDLNKLPNTVDYLVITATIEGQQTMQELGASQVWLEQAGQRLAAYPFSGSAFASERAVMLLQVYRKQGIWRINAIGQGFNGGLAALVTHFGGEVAEESSAPVAQSTAAPTTTASSTAFSSASKSTSSSSSSSSFSAPQPNINLKKITLDKPGSEHRVSLTKGSKDVLRVEAIWVDNGDASANNDDLDLRVGLLAQHGKHGKAMTYIHAPQEVGSLRKKPYVQHQGDVRVASANEPGKEVVLVNPEIAKHYGGKVALVFSVYSAVSNGVVSIASLQPKMRMQYQDQVVECVFNIEASPKAKSSVVYTYVIGIAIIDEHGITLQHSGETSKRMSEATPRLLWKGDKVDMKIDGAAMFKLG